MIAHVVEAASYNLGLIGTSSYSADTILYRNTDRYTFSTAAAGNASSFIYVRFPNVGGGGYNVDLYTADGFHIGSTSVYFSRLYFDGGTYNLGDGTSTAVMNVRGLPVGTYTIIVSRSSLTGSNGPYILGFTLANPPSVGGGGGKDTGGGDSEVGGGVIGNKAAVEAKLRNRKKLLSSLKAQAKKARRSKNLRLYRKLVARIRKLNDEIDVLRSILRNP